MSSLGSRGRIQRYVALLWLLTALFAARVAGQAVQHWFPQPFLPAFGSFQGSNLPYSVLLTSQLTILGVMIWSTRRMQVGRLRSGAATAGFLMGFGALYMIVSVGRIVIGLTWAEAPSWFRTWIPAAFHIVLAGFVLTLAWSFGPGSRAEVAT